MSVRARTRLRASPVLKSIGTASPVLRRAAPAGALHRIRVGGVPEHFNTPWHTAEMRGCFAAAGLDVAWTDFPGGTGAMNAALRGGEIDVALALTEGLVADLHRGNPSKLLGTYVSSPLTWGVHVPAGSALESMTDLDDARYAVSRPGSGSHLMACVDRHARGLAPTPPLEVVGDLAGARAALSDGSASAFMWEKYTTKHLVDSGEWRRIGEVPTPWPCFSIAARDEAIASSGAELLSMLGVVRGEARRLAASADIASIIGIMYEQREPDVAEWLRGVRWSCEPVVSHATLAHVMGALVDAGVLEAAELRAPADLVASLAADGDPAADPVRVAW